MLQKMLGSNQSPQLQQPPQVQPQLLKAKSYPQMQ